MHVFPASANDCILQTNSFGLVTRHIFRPTNRNSDSLVAPKKRGRKAAAVAAPNKEEEEAEKKAGAKRGRKAMASVEEEVRTIDEESNEEKKAEDAPELLCPSQKFLLQQRTKLLPGRP